VDKRQAMVEFWNGLEAADRRRIGDAYFNVHASVPLKEIDRVTLWLSQQVRFRFESFRRLPAVEKGKRLASYGAGLPFPGLREVVYISLAVVAPVITSRWHAAELPHLRCLGELCGEEAVAPELLAELAADLHRAAADATQTEEARKLLDFCRIIAPQAALFDAQVTAPAGPDADAASGEPATPVPEPAAQDLAPDPLDHEAAVAYPVVPEMPESQQAPLTGALELANAPATDPAPDPAPAIEAEPPPAPMRRIRQAIDHEAFDRMLIRETLRALADADDASAQRELDDVLNALLRMAPERPRNFFHLGFADAALPGRTAHWTHPLLNAERRGWYLLGLFSGHLRQQAIDNCQTLLAEHEPLFQDLVAGRCGGTRVTTAWLLLAGPGLYQIGELARLRRLLQSTAVDFGAISGSLRTLVTRIAQDGRRHLKQGDIELGAACHACLENLPFRDEDSPHYFAELAFQLRHVEACVNIARRDFEAARVALEKLMDDAVEADEGFDLSWYTDLGMARAGFVSLTALALPSDPDARRDLRRRLESGEQNFIYSREQQEPSGRGTLALAFLGYLRWFERGSSALLGDALQRVGQALETLPLLPDGENYRRDGALTWCHFMMAVLQAEQLEADALPSIRRQIEAFSDIDAQLPAQDLHRLIDALALQDQATAANLLSRLGNAGIDITQYLTNAELLSRSPALCDIARARANNPRLLPADAWPLWHTLMHAHARRAETEGAADALEELVAIARRGDRVPETQQLLHTSGEAERLLGRHDLLVQRADLAHARGNRPEMYADLTELFYLYNADNAEQARLHLQEMRELKVPREQIADLEAALVGEEERHIVVAPSRVLSNKIFRLVFVGGDERQERNQPGVMEDLRREFPNAKVHFIHSGWSPNYGRYFDEAMRELKEAKALVLMQLLRTNLGRMLRSETPVPWFACPGRGRQAMHASLRAAAVHAIGRA
jgi:hypothetical protein